MNTLAIAFWLFLLLQVGDAVTTYLVVARKYGREANPIMKTLIETLGLDHALIFSKALLFVLGAVAYHTPRIEMLFWALNVVYAIVVLWNTRVILRAAKP